MKFINISLENAYVIEPEPFKDTRGLFSRIFCEDEFRSINLVKKIVQVNHSITIKQGTIRGMHFQRVPMAEIKMVKCLRGSAFDVIIDLRKDSPTFLKWHGEILSAENMKMMVVPEGFAHGFQSMEQNSELLYFTTNFYSPEHEGVVRYDDPLIGISWPMKATDISEKDKKQPSLKRDFEGVVL
jgi:dTDP-4-dehydrorhamnose 3,5-epimerase